MILSEKEIPLSSLIRTGRHQPIGGRRIDKC
jgi:hypothetical protein